MSNCFIKQGNLLAEEDATFIVNASNTKLILGSGVSMSFKHHCGIELQQEMNTQLSNMSGRLEKGDVVATSSAKATNFKYALHVAVMDYNQGVRGSSKLPNIKDIEVGLLNIESYIQWYREKNSTEEIKLVLPLMGCGVGGLNKLTVIDLYKKFCNRDSMKKCDVVVYGYDLNDYELIRENIF